MGLTTFWPLSQKPKIGHLWHCVAFPPLSSRQISSEMFTLTQLNVPAHHQLHDDLGVARLELLAAGPHLVPRHARLQVVPVLARRRHHCRRLRASGGEK